MKAKRESLKDIKPVYDFFSTFSKLESALKGMGYGRKSSRGGIEVDWNKAEKLLSKRALNKKELFALGKNFWKHPPREQVIDKFKHAYYAEMEPSLKREEITVKIALKLIKRVRNNLFHGGKNFYSPSGPTERDSVLLSEARAILLALVIGTPLEHRLQYHDFF